EAISFSSSQEAQPARCARRITLVVKREKTMTETKKSRSRESSTPFWMASKWVMTLKAEIVCTSQGFAQCTSRSVTGGHPANIKKRQSTTERMKLTTWLRVMAEVIAAIDR